MVWRDDEEPGLSKMEKERARKAKIEAERDQNFCTSCYREKQTSEFDDGKRTCRACLDAQRLKRALVSGLITRRVNG